MFVALSFSVSVCAGASCGDTTASPGGERLDLRQCADNWRTVYSPEQGPNTLIPKTLGWQGGRLYTAVWEQTGARLIAFPDVGGERDTLVEGQLVDLTLRVEGDTVLFVGLGEPVNLPNGSKGAPMLLESIPGTGGPSRAIVTIRDAGAAPIALQAWAVDSEQAYWVEGQFGPSSALWASSRTGGGPRMLASLDSDTGFTLFNAIQPVGDHLLVYPEGIGFDRPVYSVPKAGGEVQRLPTAWQTATLIGVTSNGTVLVQHRTEAGNGEAGSELFTMGRLRPGAAAVEPFWFDQPQTAYVVKAWDDGADGLYVHAWEWDRNGAYHATIWSVDANSRGRRLACDPVVGSTIVAAAVGPDGIYGVVQLDNTANYWSVVKISR